MTQAEAYGAFQDGLNDLAMGAGLLAAPVEAVWGAGLAAGRVAIGVVDNVAPGLLSPAVRSDLRGMKSAAKEIGRHQDKIADLRSNPTLPPGMVKAMRERTRTFTQKEIARAVQRRIDHFQREINAFQKNFNEIFDKYN